MLTLSHQYYIWSLQYYTWQLQYYTWSIEHYIRQLQYCTWQLQYYMLIGSCFAPHYYMRSRIALGGLLVASHRIWFGVLAVYRDGITTLLYRISHCSGWPGGRQHSDLVCHACGL